MTLLQLKQATAYYLEVDPARFTDGNGNDLWLIAVNQVRREAQMLSPFEFTRSLVTVQVDAVTGGDLTTAVLVGTTTPVEIDQIVDVGLLDDYMNLRPVEWTTVGASLEEQREDNPWPIPRYPTDSWSRSNPWGGQRFTFSGNNVFFWPKAASGTGVTYTLGIECYAMPVDWTSGDLASEIVPWTTKGAQMLQFGCVLHLNQVIREYVSRQEGNLGPPQALYDKGMEAFRTWDILRLEQSRRHAR